MSDAIDYYFTCPSPFAFLGHDTLMKIARDHGKQVNFKPFNLQGVWAESGAVMPAERPLVRQRYRQLELKRVSEFRNICLNHKPAHFPTNPTLADQSVCALVMMGEDPADYARSIGRALWEQEAQIADEDVLLGLLETCGHDAAAVIETAKSPEAEAMRANNTKDAIAHDAVGAPAYVYDGEVFWGQDRLEYLDHMISTGRKPFSVDM